MSAVYGTDLPLLPHNWSGLGSVKNTAFVCTTLNYGTQLLSFLTSGEASSRDVYALLNQVSTSCLYMHISDLQSQMPCC